MAMDENSVFNTTNVLDNEIIKANDFTFAFEALISNVAKSTQMMLESNQDFVINGKVLPDSGMKVKVSPIYGVCKSTGVPFGRTEIADDLQYAFDPTTNGRVDILEVKGDWETYDNQQRAFNDPDTDTQTYQYVNTKKRMLPVYQIKKGEEGGSVAPSADSGWVKLAEIVIPANASSITAEMIKNITADIAGMDNDEWTTEKDKTYNIGYISDVNARFRVAHNEDGTHQEDCIDSSMLDIGVGEGQVNGNILPIGTTIANIPTQTENSSTDAIATIISRVVALITSLYNSYLKYGEYNFKGELCVSAIADANNDLTSPIKISADGSGNATIKIGTTTVLSIDSNNKLHTNYTVVAADNANTVVNKAVTDAISTALTNLTARVAHLEDTINPTFDSNSALSAGTNGRFNVDSTNVYVATTQNVTLSGAQTIDGISSLADGVVVLVKEQTDNKENGLYQYNSLSAWTRLNDFLIPSAFVGKLFSVTNGTSNGKRMFYIPNSSFAPEDDDFSEKGINFLEYFGSILPAPNRLAMRDSNACVKTAEPNQANDAATKNYVDPVVISTDSNNNVKVVTGAPALKANMSIKFFFTTTMTGTDTTTGMKISYNGTAIDLKAVKNGTLVDLLAHEVAASDYRYIQAYTTIEVIYNGGYFVVVGNPVVLSSSDYTIYADGQKTYPTPQLEAFENITIGVGSANATIIQKAGFLYLYWGATGTDHVIFINGIGLTEWEGRGSNCFAVSKGDTVYQTSTSGLQASKIRYYKD